jgi:N-acetylmuramoyl-L-alanine amidase
MQVTAVAAAATLLLGTAGRGQPATNAEPAAAWVPLACMAEQFGLTNQERSAEGVAFSNAFHALRLYAGRRGAVLDGVTVWLHQPPRDAGTNDLRDVSRTDCETLLQPLLLATAAPPPRLCIVLDAGHGGEDTGARSAAPEVHEKDVALDIARQVAGRLTAAGQHVVQSRPHDAFETLGSRVRAAEKHHAQLFVSIHANSAPSNRLALGAETYILPAAGFSGTGENGHTPTNACPGNRHDPANALLGFALQRRCAPLAGMDRGLKRARYFVLKEAPCPAALVECGFLTNTNDTTRLADPGYRRQFAAAVAEGILDYTRLALPPAAPAAPGVATNGNGTTH